MYKLKICPKHEKTLIINYKTIITKQYITKQNNTILFICFLFKLFTLFELIEPL